MRAHQTAGSSATKQARLYRIVMEKHICPYGLKAKYLLKREGYTVEDHWLKTREETDAFKAEHDVKTTPQTFVNGERIGGYDDTRRFLGKKIMGKEVTSYKPVIAIFTTAALMALAVSWALLGNIFSMRTAEWFIAFSMCILAVQKLQDVDSFATMFLSYDLLARRWVPYAWIYPFGELLAGVLMIARTFNWISVPVALFIGTVGAVSVFYAVYVQKREIKCACAGGSSNVPLGFVSLTENLMMIAMAFWMIVS